MRILIDVAAQTAGEKVTELGTPKVTETRENAMEKTREKIKRLGPDRGGGHWKGLVK